MFTIINWKFYITGSFLEIRLKFDMAFLKPESIWMYTECTLFRPIIMTKMQEEPAPNIKRLHHLLTNFRQKKLALTIFIIFLWFLVCICFDVSKTYSKPLTVCYSYKNLHFLDKLVIKRLHLWGTSTFMLISAKILGKKSSEKYLQIQQIL